MTRKSNFDLMQPRHLSFHSDSNNNLQFKLTWIIHVHSQRTKRKCKAVVAKVVINERYQTQRKQEKCCCCYWWFSNVSCHAPHPKRTDPLWVVGTKALSSLESLVRLEKTPAVYFKCVNHYGRNKGEKQLGVLLSLKILGFLESRACRSTGMSPSGSSFPRLSFSSLKTKESGVVMNQQALESVQPWITGAAFATQ